MERNGLAGEGGAAVDAGSGARGFLFRLTITQRDQFLSRLLSLLPGLLGLHIVEAVVAVDAHSF